MAYPVPPEPPPVTRIQEQPWASISSLPARICPVKSTSSSKSPRMPNRSNTRWTRKPARSSSIASCPHRRSEEHTSELQSLMRISYAVFCLKQKKRTTHQWHVYHALLQQHLDPHTMHNYHPVQHSKPQA